MTPDRYLPKEKSLERADILENPEAYEFYKKKYIEKEYSDKIKKQKEILKKAEDKRIANIYGSEKLETDTPGKGDPGMFLKPKKKETNLDDVPSPYVTGIFDHFLNNKDYMPLIQTNRGCPFSCIFCQTANLHLKMTARPAKVFSHGVSLQ